MPKESILPQVRVEQEFRTQVEAMLLPGESLSDFVENAVRQALDYRRYSQDFHARTQLSLERYLATGQSHSSQDVLNELRKRTQARRAVLASRGK